MFSLLEKTKEGPRFAVWGGRMNLLEQVEPLHKPRFRLPLTEACTPRSVAIHLG
jgi:hypothetical protein